MTAHQRMRIYADTSVYGGVFDEEFSTPSKTFFEQVREGRFVLVDSPLVGDELVDAPKAVRLFHEDIAIEAESATLTQEAVRLQESYISAGVVSPKWEVDALHVALATSLGRQIIVSWNFKHIVHFEKIAGYNEVNIAEGFSPIRIHTPRR